MLDVEHEHVTSLRPGEHFYQLVVPCAGMALIIAGPNGWACFETRILYRGGSSVTHVRKHSE